ncbi:MAG: hypothetical protein GY913_06190 [Proteobacteria bacterium]|nr:hypothetical protein [Pseudomonadota bacterium]MCP4916496.1 hypothetical protein [Pseudomonadota bacterium]
MLTLLATLTTAEAADDVDLTLLSHRGENPVVDPTENLADYQTVVQELGVAVANKPMNPAETLGVNGFEVGIASTLAFNSNKGVDGSLSPWDRVNEDGDASNGLWIPWVMVRKGLPLSAEVGANLGWVGFSRQTIFGGYGRIAPLEGYKQAPDVAFQIGYAGYVGNDQIELGAMDWSGTLSYTLPFGTLLGINSASFAPYAGAGQVILHAQSKLDADLAQNLGITPVSGFKNTDAYDATDPQWRKARIHGGMRIVSRTFHMKLGATWTPQVMPEIHVGMGFTF